MNSNQRKPRAVIILSVNLSLRLSLPLFTSLFHTLNIKISTLFFKHPLAMLIYFFSGVKAAEDPGALQHTRILRLALDGGRKGG